MSEHIFAVFASIGIAFALILIGREITKRKFGKIQGHQKLFGIISIIIGTIEGTYLGISLGFFEFALEIITSIGVGIVVLGIALQHQLKNIVAGIGVFFNKEIDVGDIVTIDDNVGTIIELHLTRTIALTDDGEKVMIPNQKFAEDVVKIRQKQRKDNQN